MRSPEEPGGNPSTEQGPDGHEDEAMREVAVPPKRYQRIVGRADEDVQVRGLGGQQGGQRRRGD